MRKDGVSGLRSRPPRWKKTATRIRSRLRYPQAIFLVHWMRRLMTLARALVFVELATVMTPFSRRLIIRTTRLMGSDRADGPAVQLAPAALGPVPDPVSPKLAATRHVEASVPGLQETVAPSMCHPRAASDLYQQFGAQALGAGQDEPRALD